MEYDSYNSPMDGKPLMSTTHPQPPQSLLQRCWSAIKDFLGLGPQLNPESREECEIVIAHPEDQDYWDKRIARGENIYLITEQAYLSELAKYSEKA